MRIAVVLTLAAASATALADPDRPLGRLDKELPPGWSLLATENELVIRHDGPVYSTTDVTGGPLVTLELRYRLEPKWTTKQVADAHAANARIASELKDLRTRYKIDQIDRAKPTADERTRLAAFATAEHAAKAREVKLPLCTLGESSLFDDGAYAMLDLKLDPPDAITEGKRVAELVKKECR